MHFRLRTTKDPKMKWNFWWILLDQSSNNYRRSMSKTTYWTSYRRTMWGSSLLVIWRESWNQHFRMWGKAFWRYRKEQKRTKGWPCICASPMTASTNTTLLSKWPKCLKQRDSKTRMSILKERRKNRRRLSAIRSRRYFPSWWSLIILTSSSGLQVSLVSATTCWCRPTTVSSTSRKTSGRPFPCTLSERSSCSTTTTTTISNSKRSNSLSSICDIPKLIWVH